MWIELRGGLSYRLTMLFYLLMRITSAITVILLFILLLQYF